MHTIHNATTVITMHTELSISSQQDCKAGRNLATEPSLVCNGCHCWL